MVLLGYCLTLSCGAHAQEIAGRLIVAVGDVTILRGDRKISGQRGTEVRSGDTLQLGTQSNAQLLLTDDSVIALRQETLFKVSDYAFQAKDPDAGHAAFNLLKGGLRTVTGLIGKRKRDNYSVQTPVATIGIRGTHYNLVHCDSNCRNPNGSLAPNGTYGGVTDGRIGVTNQSGEHQFGHDQYFHVASPASAPQPLIAPPGFLRDKLEGRASSARKDGDAAAGQQQGQSQSQQAQQQSQGQQQTLTTAPSSDANVTATTATNVTTTALTTNTFQVTSNAGTGGGITTLLQPSFTGTIFYRIAGALNIVPTACGSPPCGVLSLGDIVLGINYAAGRATVAVHGQFNPGDVINFSTPATSGGAPITISGNQVTFAGTFDLANFPQSQGSFRCSQCGPGNTPGFATQLSFSGTVNGSQATVNLSVMDSGGGGGSLTATLPQVAPPNNSAAAIALPNQAGGTNARSAAYFNVLLDGAGRLLDFGPIVGGIKGNVNSAANTIVGSAPAVGNLVWGTWGAGAQVTDFNYTTFLTSTVQPWITGDATNSIPASLGTQTFTVIPNAWVVNGSATNGTVNSGTLTADFLNRTIAVSLNVSRNTGQLNTFQMNGSGGFAPTSSRFSQGFTSVTCTGPCTGPAPSGSFGGFFAGSQAQGAGIAFTAGNSTGNGVTGVAALKR
jgi:hypothetical protein